MGKEVRGENLPLVVASSHDDDNLAKKYRRRDLCQNTNTHFRQRSFTILKIFQESGTFPFWIVSLLGLIVF